MTFASSVQKVFERVLSNPFTLLLYSLVLIVFISEITASRGPLPFVIAKLETYISNHPDSSPIKSLALTAFKIVTYIDKHKQEFVSLALYVIPLLLEFSIYNFILSLFLSFLAYSLFTDLIVSFVCANIVLIYILQSEPTDKVVTLFITAISLYLIYFHYE